MQGAALRCRKSCPRLIRERAVRALRFGADVQERRQHHRERIVDAASLTPPEPLVRYLDVFRFVFRRWDTREVARLYATGLPSKLPRISGETMKACAMKSPARSR